MAFPFLFIVVVKKRKVFSLTSLEYTNKSPLYVPHQVKKSPLGNNSLF